MIDIEAACLPVGMGSATNLNDLVLKLFEIGAVKFGNFTLKSGIQSPVYFDLRVIISYPDLMIDVSEHLYQASKTGSTYQSVCGVPYTALPLATCISTAHKFPMLIRRKEAKDYGTKKIIEGHYKPGDVCLVVEDVVTSGSSVLETVLSLQQEEINVTDAVVLVDREQGGKDMLKTKGIKLHSVCTITQILEVLGNMGKLEQDVINRTKQFIHDNRFNPNGNVKRSPEDEGGDRSIKRVLTYGDRAKLCSHSVAKFLFTTMEDKQTNLALSADVTTGAELLRLADAVGPHICILKTHIDIISDFKPDLVHDLSHLAEKHGFLIFEDRKFADIGNTVKHQYSSGVYRISDWSHIINAHALPGPGIVQGLKEVGLVKDRACLLIAEMSSKGNLATGDYAKATLKMAEEHDDFVIGFITQSKLSNDPNWVHITPGVKLTRGKDSLGQQYLTPREVICDKECDIIIVGRGITEAEDSVVAAKAFQEAGYNAYLERMQKT
ncbi:uridine 5'-monophosphate synthase isoform X4 [Lingula anatina]|uniref:Uridine 5'-monophosphate synthase n=1 Tax=Lingula anatina TaxID=7574 RepID=A0A1S3H997_LINAN|nr:uridine 5'-monophosphate synthase isoform X4 [Lingula anatina]|eukprot:XP_013382583.1 uridine 5'-monophosphate synthase isoform X4 [Lingula anatina]